VKLNNFSQNNLDKLATKVTAVKEQVTGQFTDEPAHSQSSPRRLDDSWTSQLS